MLSKRILLSPTYKRNLFQFARRFENMAWLDSQSGNQLQDEVHSTEDTLIALGSNAIIKGVAGSALDDLRSFVGDKKWAFGFLAYDLKNEIEEGLVSENFDGLSFPSLCFFEPQAIVRIKDHKVDIFSTDEELLVELCQEANWDLENDEQNKAVKFEIKSRISRSAYIKKIREIKEHIAKGDVYEMNFCHEFYAENAMIDPFDVHQELVEFSPTPFSSFVRMGSNYVMSASPERFIKKRGSKVISQPIKGTIRRGKNSAEDKLLIDELSASEKERSENIMIVDLVRNDLSQIAQDGSVQVDELCKVNSFSQVHQLISTVSCEARADIDSIGLIKRCFPMGSMTGAPKVKVMQLIEHFEESKRGLYSGSIGYFSPDGDFDFNVVIRSILYNSDNRYVSFSVGGAITHNSDPVKEYEETLLKAKGMMEVLSK